MKKKRSVVEAFGCVSPAVDPATSAATSLKLAMVVEEISCAEQLAPSPFHLSTEDPIRKRAQGKKIVANRPARIFFLFMAVDKVGSLTVSLIGTLGVFICSQQNTRLLGL